MVVDEMATQVEQRRSSGRGRRRKKGRGEMDILSKAGVVFIVVPHSLLSHSRTR